jgi:rSAM/selenodomain-associated transferase 1
MCKAPRPGATKTRLASSVGPERAAALSASFLRDVADAIESVPDNLSRRGYGIYAPVGTEAELRTILPASFGLLLQQNADFGMVLRHAARELLSLGHDCAVLINADSPTLPVSCLTDAIDALRAPGDRVVLGPAIDGGYYLIGLKADHPPLFEGIPWSTADVLSATLERAREIALAVHTLPTWYDIDDADSFALLLGEIAGQAPPFAQPGLVGGQARATRAALGGYGARPPPSSVP